MCDLRRAPYWAWNLGRMEEVTCVDEMQVGQHMFCEESRNPSIRTVVEKLTSFPFVKRTRHGYSLSPSAECIVASSPSCVTIITINSVVFPSDSEF